MSTAAVTCLLRGTSRSEVLVKKEFSGPGRYKVTLPMSPPETALVVVSLINEHGQYFEDTISVSSFLAS